MAQQYLVENCLNTGGGPGQYLSTTIINVSEGGVVTPKDVNLRKTGGPNPEGGSIDFLSVPFASKGKISIVGYNSLVFQSGSDNELLDGTITIPTLFVEQGTFLGSVTELIGNADANVFQTLLINADVVNLVQNTTNQLQQNKLVFTYPFQAGVPSEIRFQSELLTLGMVFLKDATGLNNIPGVTMELDLTQDPPILTIRNIPFDGAGNCSAMLFII
jgi:hypothetical protein